MNRYQGYLRRIKYAPEQDTTYAQLRSYLLREGKLEEAFRASCKSIEYSSKKLFETQRQFTSLELEQYLCTFKKQGFVVIPQYYSPEYCKNFKRELEAVLKLYPHNLDFQSGAYIRHVKHTHTEKPCDLGVSRIYHIDKLISNFKVLRSDPVILQLASLYAGQQFHSGVLWYQYNQPCETTRYFHVDLFGMKRQIKSIIYLEDVDLYNGPFCYIKGSHRNFEIMRRRYESTTPAGQDTGYTETELQKIIADAVTVSAPAGSLVLADVGGIHRGLPQKTKSRSILMQSLYTHPGDFLIGR